MPVNEFCDKLSPSNWKERIVLGMAPVRLFYEIDKICKLLEFPKVDGMLPFNLFWNKKRMACWVRLPREDGMFPDNLFPSKCNPCSF
jgi:hypothetical protein